MGSPQIHAVIKPEGVLDWFTDHRKNHAVFRFGFTHSWRSALSHAAHVRNIVVWELELYAENVESTQLIR